MIQNVLESRKETLLSYAFSEGSLFFYIKADKDSMTKEKINLLYKYGHENPNWYSLTEFSNM